MAVNWARLAWTFAFAVLAVMAFFVYNEYAARFKERYGNVKVQRDVGSGVKHVAKAASRPSRAPRKIPRRSRKYRTRK